MRIWIIDAFAERPFEGNPAGVCELGGEHWPDAGWMQELAAELNLPMTAFVRPLAESGGADYGLRWFTAAAEQKICGHATLATAHALLDGPGVSSEIRFDTLSGVLAARTAGDGAITLDFPAATISEAPMPPGLVEAVGASPATTWATGALNDVLAIFEDERTVRALAPDFDALTALQRRKGIRGITVSAPAIDPDRGYDFVSRFFSPADGMPEDPVTGSAHTALAPYWSRRLGKDELTGLQVSARTGKVRTAVRNGRVELTGHAVTVLDGRLLT